MGKAYRHGDVVYWNEPDKRGAGGAVCPATWEARDDAGGLVLRRGGQSMWVPLAFLRAVVAEADEREGAEVTP